MQIWIPFTLLDKIICYFELYVPSPSQQPGSPYLLGQGFLQFSTAKDDDITNDKKQKDTNTLWVEFWKKNETFYKLEFVEHIDWLYNIIGMPMPSRFYIINNLKKKE